MPVMLSAARPTMSEKQLVDEGKWNGWCKLTCKYDVGGSRVDWKDRMTMANDERAA